MSLNGSQVMWRKYRNLLLRTNLDWTGKCGSPLSETIKKIPWLIQFMSRLLQGSPVVIALLENNPFPNNPPKYVQAMVYDYRFTDSEICNQDNSWWTRKTSASLHSHLTITQLAVGGGKLSLALLS